MTHDALDPVAVIASLRSGNAAPFDPVRLHFLESLARRTHAHEGAVRSLLDGKLRQALATYQERMAAANLAGPGRQACPTPPSALAALTRALTHQAPNHAQAHAGGGVDGSDARMGDRPELKSLRYFRDTWSKLSVDKQLAQALKQAPGNAGPLNSHQLVLRSLSVMRDMAPDYLNRFMSYADTLLWLDQADSRPAVKSPAEGELVKKRKPSSARTR